MSRPPGSSTRRASPAPVRHPAVAAAVFAFGVLSLGLPSGVASGASPASSVRSVGHRSGAAGGLDLAKLGSLTDYTAKLVVDGRLEETFRVHSPTDRETFTGGPFPLSVDVGGWRYLRVPKVSGTKVTYAWQKMGRPHPYRLATYPSYAVGFGALTHVTGAKLVRGGVCHEAGLAGRLWHFAAAARGAVYPHVSACVADRSGALLSYDEAPLQTFVVTGVGDVAPIPVP